MGLMQERLTRSGEIGNALAPVNLNPSEIKTNSFPLAEPCLGVKIREVSRMLSVEQKEGKERGLQPQETSKNGFEPFVNPQPSENSLFVNNYNGNFAQKMELNRKGIENVLKIAHLDGQVFLTTLSSNRQRSIEANPDGSVTRKRSLFFGEEIEDSQKEINPPWRTVPTKDGWRIEINDGKIIEDLNEKKLTGEKRQKTFIKTFSQLLNKGLFECIRKEKMTRVKDENLKRKAFLSVLNPAIGLSVWTPTLFQSDLLASITGFTSAYFIVNAFINSLELFLKRQMDNTNSSAYRGRKLDARWEYLMPEVEVDKVLRSFLLLKTRTLVKEKKPEVK